MAEADTTTEQQTETTTTSATGTGGDELTAIQQFLSENKLTPGQLKSRLADSRKWEDRAKARADYDDVKAELDKVRKANLSQAEKDLEAKFTEGRATGEAEARATYGAALVKAEARGMLAGRGVEDARAQVLTEHLASASYLTDDGSVDSKALSAYIDAVAPKPDQTRTGQWAPAAFGAGTRESATQVEGAAGLAEAQRRFAKKS